MVKKQRVDQSTRKMNGRDMMALAERLYPICRSITGEGVRRSLQILQSYLPLQIVEVPSHTKVLDWTIPKEWNIREAWIKAPDGSLVVDFSQHNLHVLNYSRPIHTHLSLDELKAHLYTLPEQPDCIPYRTSYYQENWGFCLSHHTYLQLEEGTYEVYIDSSLEDGSLSFGELYLPGETEEEVLFSTHICHPSLANDNLSGIGVMTALAQQLQQQSNHYSYRFLFIPGTIGAITWLALNKENTHRIKHGLVAALLGNSGAFTYKRSRQGNVEIDQVVEKILLDEQLPHQIIDFYPYGYDERQFCSPGFNLPVGNLGRTPYGQFPEYHTSNDNLEFINAANLQNALDVFLQIVEALEKNKTFLNLQPYGEPQLGKRGLYEAIGGENDSKSFQLAMLWVLNQSDGQHSLLDIAKAAKLPFTTIARAAELLNRHGLLEVRA